MEVAIPVKSLSPTYYHPDIFTGRIPFLSPNQQCQSTEGRKYHTARTCSSKASDNYKKNCQQSYAENKVTVQYTYVYEGLIELMSVMVLVNLS